MILALEELDAALQECQKLKDALNVFWGYSYMIYVRTCQGFSRSMGTFCRRGRLCSRVIGLALMIARKETLWLIRLIDTEVNVCLLLIHSVATNLSAHVFLGQMPVHDLWLGCFMQGRARVKTNL